MYIGDQLAEFHCERLHAADFRMGSPALLLRPGHTASHTAMNSPVSHRLIGTAFMTEPCPGDERSIRVRPYLSLQESFDNSVTILLE
jgi:hypothetical protein